MKDEFNAIVEYILKWRQQYAADFPIPSKLESIQFAFTEVAEAVDAKLRENPNFKRNKSKEISYVNELCDVIFMLVTYLGSGAYVKSLSAETGLDISLVAVYVSHAMRYHDMNMRHAHDAAVEALEATYHLLCLETDEPLAAVIRKLDSIVEKRISNGG